MTPPDPCTTHSEQRLTHPCEAGKTISKGFGIAVLPSGHVELHVTDGFDAALRICTSAADPRGTLWDGLPHMITFTLDGAAKATGPHAPPTHGARRSPAAVLRCGSTAEYHVSRAGLPGAARVPVGCAALSPALPPPKRGRHRGVGNARRRCHGRVPQVATVVVDDRLCDGGQTEPQAPNPGPWLRSRRSCAWRGVGYGWVLFVLEGVGSRCSHRLRCCGFAGMEEHPEGYGRDRRRPNRPEAAQPVRAIDAVHARLRWVHRVRAPHGGSAPPPRPGALATECAVARRSARAQGVGLGLQLLDILPDLREAVAHVRGDPDVEGRVCFQVCRA